MSSLLPRLVEAGVLSPLDLQFAGALARLDPRAPELLQLGAAFASRAVAHGHVCADLPKLCGKPLVDGHGEPIVDVTLPPVFEWVMALGASTNLVGDGTRPTPLVLDGRARLYLGRYFAYEQQLAQALAQRARVEFHVDEDLARTTLQRLFAADGSVARDRGQREAAAVAALRGLTVISGGPGTGKTTTLVRLLALLQALTLAQGLAPLRVALLAPTGKAAAKMAESVGAGRDGLPCAAEVRDAIEAKASTIHRLLGWQPATPTQFAHHRDRPVLADVVVVDEASMVDVALMAKLVDALGPQTRLVLVGDKDQLASVEAGAIFGEVCNAGAEGGRGRSSQFAETLGRLLGDARSTDPRGTDARATDARAPDARAPDARAPDARAPDARDTDARAPDARAPDAGDTDARGTDAGDRATGAMADCVVELVHNYRFGGDSAIGTLAAAMRQGDRPVVARLLRAAHDDDRAQVRLIDLDAPEGLAEILRPAVLAGFSTYLRAADPAERLAALADFRLLCPHRRGPFGVEGINAMVQGLLADEGLIEPNGPWFHGRPVMVTRNDVQLGLANGDVGIVHREKHGPIRAWFPGPDGGLRSFSASRLPPLESVWAMTVHKSQGSEFDTVAILVPTRGSLLLTRELLYTALTRARRQATFYGRAEVILAAIEQRIDRASGLTDALWGGAQ